MNCALYDEYIKAVYKDKTWPNNLKSGVLAWAIAEQGENRFSVNGMGELARNANNFHSLHQRKEMKLKYPCVYHLLSTNEVDNNYIDFPGPQDELEGLMMFIHRPYYGDVDAHMGSFEELLRFLCEGTPSFCPTKGYVERVLSFLPEAEMELRKIGWMPEDPNPGAKNDPNFPHPEVPMKYSVHNGLLYSNGEPVPFFETPYMDKWVKNTPMYFMFHFTANDSFDGQCKYFQKNTPEVSPHFLIGEAGQVSQFVPIHLPAHHSGSSKWNRQTIGFELVNLGCSRTTIGDNVIFVKWNGVRMIPKSKCLYAHHQLEPNIYRWWPEFTTKEYDAINSILPCLRKEYEPRNGRMSMIGHESVCAEKVDPGPNFDWRRIGG